MEKHTNYKITRSAWAQVTNIADIIPNPIDIIIFILMPVFMLIDSLILIFRR